MRAPTTLLLLLLCACGGNALRGTATLDGFQSSAGIQVELFFGQNLVATTTTSKTGAYSLPAPHKGLYALAVTPKGSMEGPFHADVLVDGDSVAPDVVFTPAGTISGGFTPAADCASKTVVGYTVVSKDLSIHSDADGGFTLVAPVGARNLEVQFEQLQGSLQYVDVPVVYGHTTPLTGLSPPAPATYSAFKGWAQVLCDSVQNAGVAVRLTGPCDYSTVTDSIGRYELPSIRPGTYTVSFTPPQGTVRVSRAQDFLPDRYDVPYATTVNAESRSWGGMGVVDGTAMYSDNRADKSGITVGVADALQSVTTTDDSGFFSLSALCGTRQVCALGGGTCATAVIPWSGAAHLATTLVK